MKEENYNDKKMADDLIKIASKYKTENGCRIKITSPAGRYLDTLIVENVYDNGTIAGYSEAMDIDTAYYITDGIGIEFLNED